MAKRKPDKRGRGTGQLAKFVALEQFILESAAWCSMTVNARQAYVEIARLYNGKNNGTLALSARMLSDRLHISKMTASRALKELSDRGFVEALNHGGFNLKTGCKRATEWRLNRFKCDVTSNLPSKIFMAWKPAEIHFAVSPQAHPGITTGPLKAKTGQKCTSVGTTRYRNGSFEGQSGITTGPHIHSSHRLSPQAQTVEAQRGPAHWEAGADASLHCNQSGDDPATFVFVTGQPLKSIEQLSDELPADFQSWQPRPAFNAGASLAKLAETIRAKASGPRAWDSSAPPLSGNATRL